MIIEFKESFTEYGRPTIMVTDNGPAFRGQIFSKFLKGCDVRHVIIPSRHYSSNGLVERFNKTLSEALMKLKIIDPTKEWTDNLPMVINQYNETIHRVTRFKPKDILEGKVDWQIANSNTMRQQKYDAERINRKRKPANLQVGSKVLIDLPERYQKKFQPKRIGPFKVTEKFSDEIVLTDRTMPKTLERTPFHSSLMRIVP